jgi:LmbE family N-acetylglucosaminyl deacetylase
MAEAPLRLLIIGAHPDDADYHAGGLAALYRSAGHVVKMVSLTNGDAGHQTLRGTELAQRRRREAKAAGAVIGADYEVLDHHDGELLPTLENRLEMIRLLRLFRPDLLLTHRPNDYHPDHRATSLVIQDAAYLVTVPALAPEVRHLAENPVIAYTQDNFLKPCPFRPDVVVDVGSVLDQIVAMLNCHESQFYEWLPYNKGRLAEVPRDAEARRIWLKSAVAARLQLVAQRYRPQLEQAYGSERGSEVEFAEAFEVCEYGAPLDDQARRRLFPFLPARSCGQPSRGEPAQG